MALRPFSGVQFASIVRRDLLEALAIGISVHRRRVPATSSARRGRGKRIDPAFMQTLYDKIPEFDTFDRLAGLMTTASDIATNPRLIKRFLNALAIAL